MYFCVVLCIVCFVSFSELFVCVCAVNYCQRVATQLQLNISYIIYIYIYIYIYISYHVSYMVFISTHYLIKFSKIPTNALHSSTSFLQLKHYNSYMFRPFSGRPQEAYIGICVCTCGYESSLISLTHAARRTGIWYPVEARLFIVRLWLAYLPVQWHVNSLAWRYVV
jgi:hypothetical protein